MRKLRPRGLNLIEMILVSGLFSLAMLMFHSMTQHWVRKVNKTEVSLDMQSQALKALSWINSEFAESTEDAVWDETFTSPDNGIVFASPRDLNGQVRLDSSGRILWQKYVCFYLGDIDGKPALIMKQREISPPSAEIPGQRLVSEFVSDSSLPIRVIAHNITRFEGQMAGDTTIPWDILIEARKSYGNSDLGVRVETAVFFRN